MKPEHVDYIPYLIAKMAAYPDVKLLAGLAWGAVVFLFGDGQGTAILALFLLVLADWVFGMIAAKVSGEQITSAKCFRTPIKLTVYFSLIAACHVSEYALHDYLAILDETMTGGLVLTELLSIFEKAGKMGFAIPKRVLNQLENFRDGELSVKK